MLRLRIAAVAFALSALTAPLFAGAQTDPDCASLVPSISSPDADGDGTVDVCDMCPMDPMNISDGDGLCANEDNCPTVANAEQTDTNGNGIGDACEGNSDVGVQLAAGAVGHKKLQIVGTSPTSFAEATRAAIEEASNAVRHMAGFEVTEQRGFIKDGKVSEFQVTLLVWFKIE